MKVLTAAEMREIDRRAAQRGVHSLVLMENAGLRVVEFLAARFGPLDEQRVVVICGRGNNGGDGLVVARQLHTRFRPRSLDVVLSGPPAELKGDAAANFRMFEACGGTVSLDISPRMRAASLVVDALLGTGIDGAPRGRAAELIREIDSGFPAARVVAVDVPSGIGFDGVRACATVTLAAPKIELYQEPHGGDAGEVVVAPIGIPPDLLDDPGLWLSVSEPGDFSALFEPRPRAAHKGAFGHVLVAGGSPGKTGAAAMAGLAALRAGAGLVTVAAPPVAGFAPELMTAPLAPAALEGKSVLAAGPGLGTGAEAAALVRQMVAAARARALPIVIDADALNVLGDTPVEGCVLTPHPGEMSRLCGRPVAEIQADRMGTARRFAAERRATLVLKGHRTVIAHPDGRVWINPGGGPALATAGSGDILTGLIAGLVAQFPERRDLAVRAAVWLHGRAGDLGAVELGEKCLIATDLLRFLPATMEECAGRSR